LRLTLLIDLYETMNQEEVWTTLADYVISNYDEEMADDLIDLIVDGLPLLLDELSSLIEKYQNDTTLMAKLGNRMIATRIRRAARTKHGPHE